MIVWETLVYQQFSGFKLTHMWVVVHISPLQIFLGIWLAFAGQNYLNFTFTVIRCNCKWSQNLIAKINLQSEHVHSFIVFPSSLSLLLFHLLLSLLHLCCFLFHSVVNWPELIEMVTIHCLPKIFCIVKWTSLKDASWNLCCLTPNDGSKKYVSGKYTVPF